MLAPVVIVAATSARMLAESARRGGLRPVAFDIFGDVDTRRAAHWVGIGNRGGSRIDSQRMHAAITRLARHPQVRGWIAGGGFEDRLDLLRDCARTLPLLGNEPAAIAAAKQPIAFFGLLDRHGIAHPQTSLVPPEAPAGWLVKRIGGTGGWHVRRLAATGRGPTETASLPLARTRTGSASSATAGAQGVAPADPRQARRARRPPAIYYQREEPGQPMSALFLANGRDACLVGYNLLLTDGAAERPFVFQGAVGPVDLPAAAAQVVQHAIECLARHLELKGLNSLDFLLAGDHVSVIEVNPRPSATMQLHDHRLPGGLLNAHLAACSQRLLPSVSSLVEPPAVSPALSAAASPAWGAQEGGGPINGTQVIYAGHRLVMTRRAGQRLQALGWCHDIGREGTRSSRGDPLCSISAQADSTAAVIRLLARRVSEVERIHEEEDER